MKGKNSRRPEVENRFGRRTSFFQEVESSDYPLNDLRLSIRCLRPGLLTSD